MDAGDTPGLGLTELGTAREWGSLGQRRTSLDVAVRSRVGEGEGEISSGFRVAKWLFASQKRANIFFEFKQKVYLVPLLVIYSGTSKPS